MSSIYYGQLTVSLFGQSHAPGIGVTIDGLPAGEAIDLEELNAFLARRKPGKSPLSTARRAQGMESEQTGIKQKNNGGPLPRSCDPPAIPPTAGRGTHEG